jgi:hypothetical protein
MAERLPTREAPDDDVQKTPDARADEEHEEDERDVLHRERVRGSGFRKGAQATCGLVPRLH